VSDPLHGPDRSSSGEGRDTISVVVPAHDEAAVIGDLLDSLRPGIDRGRLEVVVVPNGCTDATAEVAQARGVGVVELADGNKTAALNAGDRAVTAFPRFYVDADVVLSADDLEALAAAFGGGVDAVAPGRRIDASSSSWAVRAYHRIWDELESTTDSLAGRGCYGVSAGGRQRWGEFPDVTADDAFVNAQFGPTERAVVGDVTSVVVAPPDVRSLLERKRRSHRGNVELELGGAEITSRTGWLRVVARHPARVLDVPVYLAVTLAARWLARRDRRRGATHWRTDAAGREARA
jgi:glycosyltransferase involved in cell wall biosynthesis